MPYSRFAPFLDPVHHAGEHVCIESYLHAGEIPEKDWPSIKQLIEQLIKGKSYQVKDVTKDTVKITLNGTRFLTISLTKGVWHV
jgi:hypothetical protein